MIKQTVPPVPHEKVIREKKPDPTGTRGHICYSRSSGVLSAAPAYGLTVIRLTAQLLREECEKTCYAQDSPPREVLIHTWRRRTRKVPPVRFKLMSTVFQVTAFYAIKLYLKQP